jgi:hypothetical protein
MELLPRSAFGGIHPGPERKTPPFGVDPGDAVFGDEAAFEEGPGRIGSLFGLTPWMGFLIAGRGRDFQGQLSRSGLFTGDHIE